MSPEPDQPDPPRGPNRLNAPSHRDRLENVFRIARPTLIKYLAALTGSRAIASDLADEAFSRMLNLDSPESIINVTAFIYVTAKRLAFRHLEQAQRQLPLDSPSVPDGTLRTDESPESLQIQGQDQDDLLRAVEELPVNLKATLIWTVWDGLSQQEIADRFAAQGNPIDVRTVRRYLTAAKTRVQQRLNHRG